MHSNILDRHIPYLRRYARHLTGSQHVGDAYVRAMLEDMITCASSPKSPPTRTDIYQRFHAMLPSRPQPGDGLPSAISLLSPEALAKRGAVLLSSLDGFNSQEIETILSSSLGPLKLEKTEAPHSAKARARPQEHSPFTSRRAASL